MPASAEGTRTTDRIEKQFDVSAKRSRVWRALANAEEFGSWFGLKIDGPFKPGATVFGQITHKGYEHVIVEMLIEKVEPEGYFSYHWHPYATDSSVDYTAEPMTLVEFRLEETAGGTSVAITESGFDRIPASRRAEAFRMNEGGWTSQSKRLAKHVA